VIKFYSIDCVLIDLVFPVTKVAAITLRNKTEYAALAKPHTSVGKVLVVILTYPLDLAGII